MRRIGLRARGGYGLEGEEVRVGRRWFRVGSERRLGLEREEIMAEIERREGLRKRRLGLIVRGV